ncbi:MnhB domain-containing protein [Pontibacter sp. SGAir0037]|uniref:MnhB domain-containing protein n=1 Tax=Pontibacter sp. SGAir0037 TaxID=2571030 RepID=UPI0010CCC99B|nr:MnhB domain-containing protein [Pontibacter sp. SGAir0037]QCR21982.1 cation:proton antiporter [Pontibacter sp. SGAir0037]
MKTIILAAALRLFFPLFIFFSFYILIRGHNHPGGGFIGGLILAIPFIFHVLIHGAAETQDTLFVKRVYSLKRKERESSLSYYTRNIGYRLRGLLPWYSREDKDKVLVRQFVIEPLNVIPVGLALSLISGLIPLFLGEAFLTGVWAKAQLPLIGKVGTTLLFDIGVYLLVSAVVLKITLVMSKE